MGRLSDEGSGRGGAMRIGDQKTQVARDKETKEITRSYTLIRTDRPYVDDLCSAYNGDRGTFGPWWVDANGNLRIGDRD